MVHLKVLSDWNQALLYDVIAKIRGAKEPDRWIVRGKPSRLPGSSAPPTLFSGHVALMAEARAIGQLVKEGWRPRRTLVYASWDGEEPGFTGVDRVGRDPCHGTEGQGQRCMSISDMNSRGTLDVEGSHGLQHFVNQVARDVQDPHKPAHRCWSG